MILRNNKYMIIAALVFLAIIAVVFLVRRSNRFKRDILTDNAAFKQEKEMSSNPIIWADVPDPDVVRVGSEYYMVSTTMHMMPGAPIMRSTDLVNWEIIGYAFEKLEDNDAHNLRNGMNIYGKGAWAPSLKFHKGKFYLVFAALDTGKTYMLSTTDPAGRWERTEFNEYMHDPALIFDDDDKAYIIYGATNLIIKELSPDYKSINPAGLNKQIIQSGKEGIEGAHAYKIDGKYYITMIWWEKGNIRRQYVYRADHIEGPYEERLVLSDTIGYKRNGVAQGGLVDTPDGKWYAMLFQDHDAVGRIPVLVPVRWEDGWPVYGDAEGKVPIEFETPGSSEFKTELVKSDEFENQETNEPMPDGSVLRLQWQWNHNPDNTKWSLSARRGYLRLTAGSVVKNIHEARNTLTQRTQGPYCSGWIMLDITNMLEGDYAGLAAFQEEYGFIGVTKEIGKRYIVMVDKGVEKERTELLQEHIYLKIDFDFITDTAKFYYSYNETDWVEFGTELAMRYTLPHFMGYRFAIFNFATKEPGGYVDIEFFRFAPELTGSKAKSNSEDHHSNDTTEISNDTHTQLSLPAIATGKEVPNGNPLISHKFGADPYVLVYNERVYVYMTDDILEYDSEGNVKDNTYSLINKISVISSDDLMNWTDHGEIPVAGPKGAAKWATQSWAPAVAHKVINGQDKFFLYFANNASGIGVLTSNSPIGPWEDPIKKPLISRSTPGVQGVVWLFDPAVLIDDDNKAYLYFGGGIPEGQYEMPNTSRVIKLGDDMISVVGEAVPIPAPFMFESAGINKYNGVYYYTYCSNFFDGIRPEDSPPAGEIAYMTSRGPMGPWKYEGTILKNPWHFFGVGGNNHHCIFVFNNRWYIAYHAQTLSKAMGIPKGYRSTHLNEVLFKSDGTIESVAADYKGVAQIKNKNPYERVEAETFAWSAGISTRPVEENDLLQRALTDIDNGDWIALSNVDFGKKGASGFTAVVSNINADSVIELRADSIDGKLIGLLNIPSNNGQTGWIEVSTGISDAVGVRDLYLIFKGKQGVKLFDIDYWQFDI